MPGLVFLSGPAAGLRHELRPPLTIGRSRACEIMLDDDKVSRYHARIDVSRGQLKLRDLNSRNGTRVNGQRIASEVVLLDGDRLQLGDSTARIEFTRDRAYSAEPSLIGAAPSFRRLLERASRAALGDEAVSIFGEVGSGRVEMARYVHCYSGRSHGPLVIVNCADERSSDELLGSGGQMDSGSALSRADGGTLVLRHLELLRRPAAQRLARFLGTKSIPVKRGERRVDVRAITIGQSSLDVLAAQRKIPRELAKAIPSVKLEVPSLRERSSDVPLLFRFFASELGRRIGREPPRLSTEAIRALMAYAWPGNVCELRLVAERLALLYPGLQVPMIRLPAEVHQSGDGAVTPTLRGRIRTVERTAIAEALSAAGGKKIRAAEMLGISRPTLDKKLRELQPAAGPRLESKT
jgi:DNA-binding NtrC family response regulator